jgi:hypothetical protein
MLFHLGFLFLVAFVHRSTASIQIISEKERQEMINSFAGLLIRFIPPLSDKSLHFATFLKQNRAIRMSYDPILRTGVRLPLGPISNFPLAIDESSPSPVLITLGTAFSTFSVTDVFEKFPAEPIVQEILHSVRKQCVAKAHNLVDKVALLERISPERPKAKH